MALPGRWLRFTIFPGWKKRKRNKNGRGKKQKKGREGKEEGEKERQKESGIELSSLLGKEETLHRKKQR